MTEHELFLLVERVANEELSRGRVVRKPWLVHKIVSAWKLPPGLDSDKFAVCAYYAVNDIAGRVVRKFRQAESSGRDSVQVALDGYRFIQSAYSVIRNGAPEVVPIELMTIEELEKKVQLLRSNAWGLVQHADELEAYTRRRIEENRKNVSKKPRRIKRA